VQQIFFSATDRIFTPRQFYRTNAVDPNQRVGDVRAYTQNYFEGGWAQELRPHVSLQLNVYLHTGHNSFENHEISISRIFVPINFHAARSEGAELVLDMRQLARTGISGRFQYALQKTYFYGPITGGFAGDEPLSAGERIVPAFDQTHTGTAQVFYHSRWHNLWTGGALRYGSGTIIEGGNRLPQHFTADLASGFMIWNQEPQWLELEINVTNASNSVYKIAKESEEIPIQYAPSRTLGAGLKFHF
jgi:hypothetical protein